jgi:hypothetical protein
VAEDQFDRLLTVMPQIAESVNRFDSSAVQEQAFDVLVRALGLGEPQTVVPDAPHMTDSDSSVSVNGDANGATGGPTITRVKPHKRTRLGSRSAPKSTTAVPTTRRRRRQAATMLDARDLDFRPKGKQSLRDFVAEKKPWSNHERNVLAVAYLEEILRLSPITAGQVLGVYRECSWREPANLAGSLQLTAHRKNWLDTSDTNALRLTTQGRNHVMHDMPTKNTGKA